MEEHRIPIISYLFPPAGGIAAPRALSVAKYLPACGYEVHVLSARNAAGPVSDHTRRRAIGIERGAAELSDRVVVATESMLEHRRVRYPGRNPQIFALIPNGYDRATFSAFQARPHRERKSIVRHPAERFQTQLGSHSKVRAAAACGGTWKAARKRLKVMKELEL